MCVCVCGEVKGKKMSGYLPSQSTEQSFLWLRPSMVLWTQMYNVPRTALVLAVFYLLGFCIPSYTQFDKQERF